MPQLSFVRFCFRFVSFFARMQLFRFRLISGVHRRIPGNRRKEQEVGQRDDRRRIDHPH